MLYGAEVGLFPHITASWLHTFGLDNRTNNTKNSKWDSIIPRRYVNSGTFLGRAKEVNTLFSSLSLCSLQQSLLYNIS